MSFVRDLTLEDIAGFLKGLPLEYGDPLTRSYLDEFNQNVPNTLQNFCLATVLQFDNNIYQAALRSLPLGFSEQVRHLLQKVCNLCVDSTKGCWACFENNGQSCGVCDRTNKVRNIQMKHQKEIKPKVTVERRKSGNETVYFSSSNEIDFPSVSTENHFKLIMTNLEHPAENKDVQRLLGDILYGNFRRVSVHYVCVHIGNWERFREKTFDKAYVVLYGLDSKEAGTFLIRLFKNPILKSILVVPAKNQKLYPEEKTGGFCYCNSV